MKNTNITYLIGTVLAVVLIVIAMMLKTTSGVTALIPDRALNFFDVSSILIVLGCTFAVVVASFPTRMIASMPKHFKIMLDTKRFDPYYCIDQLVELAQVARKNGLLALEEKANQQQSPFFKQAILLVVDANDPDKVRSILNNDIECMSSRHESIADMYDKAAGVAPAFGMVGTLVGLINMLKGMNMTNGSSSIGSDMGTALITTLYGSLLANIFFSPIASNLRVRDEEEVLCKMIIVEGILSIQSGENPKFLKEKLLTFIAQKQRESRGKAVHKRRR